jgi:hypothetical protein
MKAALFFAITIFMCPLLAYSEPFIVDRKMYCYEGAETIIPKLSEVFKEVPIWGANIGSSSLVLTINEKTRTWSILQYDNKVACIIQTGTNFFQLKELLCKGENCS